MSALSFKINAETGKLKSFITMLERLRQVLADIPDSTKEFDVINRKIGEMEARVEQAMRKIAQMERQAADVATKAVTSASTQTASGGATAGTAATKAETVAYHELLGELKAANDEKTKAIAQIRLYSNEIARLKADVTALNKEEQQNGQLSAKKRAQVLDATVSIEEYKQEISQLRRELANQIKLEQAARGSIDEMSQALGRMRTVYRSLNEGERGSSWGQTLLKNIESLDTKIKGLDASMGIHTRKVGDYAGGFNMLGFQIQQVARELPSLAYGPQIFFAAISNNLPMLADEIARANKSVVELKKAGQSFTPVWKQIASSIFSWQTLLVAGVTVLTLYGKEITSWVASLFKGKTAIDASAAALERFNSAMAQGSVSAQSELTKLNLLYRAATDLSKPYEERAEAVKKLQDIYPAYFGNMAAEQVMVGNAVGAYENLRDAIIEVAQAKAAQELITENSKGLNILKATESFEVYTKAFKEAQRAEKNFAAWQNAYGNSITSTNSAPRGYKDAAKTMRSANSALKDARAALKEELEKMGEIGKTTWKQIADDYDGNAKEYYDTVNAQNEKLAPAAEKLYTTLTPDELNAKAKKARQDAENAAKKAASDQERNLKELDKQLQKLRDDALQAEVDSMKEGTAKKLAQIDLDYQKRARAIQETEGKIRQLQGGELTKTQQAQLNAVKQANKAQYRRDLAGISGVIISPEGLAANINKEIQAWNEYLREYGTFREKLQATKEYYDGKINTATTQGEREKLKKERDASLAEIETKQSQDWVAFFSWIEAMSKNTASNIYNTLRNQLNQMLDAGKISIEEYVKTTEQLDQQYRNKLKERSKFQTFQDQGINGLIDKYQKLGDAMQLKGAQTGDKNAQAMGASMSKAAGNASGVVSMIDMIVTSIHQTIQAIQQLTDSIVEMMASFGQDAEIDTALGKWAEFSDLLSEFDNHVYSSWEKFKSGDIMGAASEATSSVLGVITSINKWIDKSKERKIQKIQDQVDALSISYDRLSRSVEKAYSTDAKELIEDQNKLLEQQKILIQRQIQEEKSKKDPDKKRIKEWEKQYEEITNLIEDNAAKAQDAIFGSDIQAAINDFAEAYADAWTKGEDRAKSSKDFVKNIIKQMVIEAMKADIQTPMQAIRDKLEKFWKDGIIDQAEEKVIDEMIKKLNKDLESSYSWADKYFEDETASKQQTTSRGFQAMSQDTGDELNGRFTDIQGKVTDVRGYVMTQTQSIINLISAIANIETAIYTSVQVDNELLRYAVMTYMEILEINGNTAAMRTALQTIQEDISAIKRNTNEL